MLPTSSVNSGQRAIRQVEQNVGLFASLTLVLAAILKVMVVAHGSTVTATALLTETDTVKVATGIALLSLPMLIVTTALALAGHAIARDGQTRFRLPEDAAIIALCLLVFVAGGWTLAAQTILGAAVLRFVGPTVIRRFSKSGFEGARAKPPAVMRLTLAALVGVVAIVLLVSDDRPWLAAESLRINGHRFTGYVLDDTNDRLVVLTDADRAVLRIPSGSTTRLGYCKPRDVLTDGSLIFLEQPDYPTCPTVRVPQDFLANVTRPVTTSTTSPPTTSTIAPASATSSTSAP